MDDGAVRQTNRFLNIERPIVDELIRVAASGDTDAAADPDTLRDAIGTNLSVAEVAVLAIKVTGYTEARDRKSLEVNLCSWLGNEALRNKDDVTYHSVITRLNTRMGLRGRKVAFGLRFAKLGLA